MKKLRIAVAEGTFAGFETGVRRIGDFELELGVVPLSSTRDIELNTSAADAIIVGLQKLGKEEISCLGPQVRAISRAGIGLDSIDLQAARTAGIAVVHQPNYATLEVATHAVALLLAVSRKLKAGDAIARRGWKGRRALGRLLAVDEITVGVIGAGAIGRAVIERLLPLVGRVLVHDPFAAGLPAGAERVEELEALLSASNAVSLHAPLTAGTRHLIGGEQLALMPQGGILVNVSRGELVDMDALISALKSGRLAGAGLDVFEEEPFSSDHPITEFDSVILTPHIAFLSDRAVARLERQALEDVLAYLTEGKVYGGRLAVSP